MRSTAYPAGASRRIVSVAVVLVALLFVALASPAEAARKSSSSVSVADGKFATTSMAYVGGDKTQVRVASSTTADNSMVRVKAECFQNGELVYRHYALVTDGVAALPLGPTPNWQSGDAECTAELGEFDKRMRFRVSASDSFHVSG